MRCLRRERRRRRWRRQEFWRTTDVRLKNTLCAELGTPWHSLALPSECILPSYASKQGVAVWTKKKNKLSTFFNNLIYLFWHSCCSCCCCLLLVAIAVSWHDMGFPQPQSHSPPPPTSLTLATCCHRPCPCDRNALIASVTQANWLTVFASRLLLGYRHSLIWTADLLLLLLLLLLWTHIKRKQLSHTLTHAHTHARPRSRPRPAFN